MKAILENDICFSTANGGRNPFNTDKQPRTELPIDLARTALDFNIVKKPSFDDTGRRIPGHFHLERDDERRSIIPTFGSIGNQYTPIQHLDVFDYITNKVMPEVPEMKLEMAGTIYGGGVGLIAAKFGDTFAIKGDDSANELRLFFNNPSNGRGRMTLGFTHVRVICQNTLIAATDEARADGWCITHTKSAPEATQHAVKCIRSQAQFALALKHHCEALAEIGVNGETMRRCLDAVYPISHLPESYARSRLENFRDEVVRQFEAGETAQTFKTDSAWKLFNSFTYPIFNPDPAKLERSKTKDAAEIAYKGMTGTVGEKVRDIFHKVYRVVREVA